MQDWEQYPEDNALFRAAEYRIDRVVTNSLETFPAEAERKGLPNYITVRV